MEKSCTTCKHAKSCCKTIGVIWGFCNTDYEPATRDDQPTNPLPDFESAASMFCEMD